MLKQINGEIFEMTADEVAEFEARAAENAAAVAAMKAAAEEKKDTRIAILSKLGITQDEFDLLVS